MNLISIKTNIFKEMIKSAIKTDIPLLVLGSPGIGKSEIVEQVAKEMGYHIINKKLQGMKPYQLLGQQIPDGDTSKFLKPEYIKEANKQPTVIFLDEINRAYPDVINVAMEMIREKRVGPHILRKETRFVLAGNLGEEDGTNVIDLDNALLGRVITIKLEADLQTWINEYAIQNGIKPEVIEFLQKFPQYFNQKAEEESEITPTPRGWTNLNKAYTYLLTLDEKLRDEMFLPQLSGIVGIEATTKFKEHLANRDLPDPKTLLTKLIKPTKIKPWQFNAIQYSIIHHLINENTKYKVSNFNILYKNIKEKLNVPDELIYTFVMQLLKYVEKYIDEIFESDFEKITNMMVEED